MQLPLHSSYPGLLICLEVYIFDVPSIDMKDGSTNEDIVCGAVELHVLEIFDFGKTGSFTRFDEGDVLYGNRRINAFEFYKSVHMNHLLSCLDSIIAERGGSGSKEVTRMDETPYVMTVNSQKYGNAVMADAQIKKMLRAAVLKNRKFRAVLEYDPEGKTYFFIEFPESRSPSEGEAVLLKALRDST